MGAVTSVRPNGADKHAGGPACVLGTTFAESFNAETSEIARGGVGYLKESAREKPEVAALWCLSIGFILGWKLKPW